jgi:hypothetical protein
MACYQYYKNQAGHGIPVYAMQTGGGLFGSLFRMAVPLLKSVAKKALPRLARAGAQIATDALDGKNIGKSAKRNLSRAGINTLRAATGMSINKKKNPAKRRKRSRKNQNGDAF